ncbi:L-aspartate oxidase, partial [Streptomyces hainanensis]
PLLPPEARAAIQRVMTAGAGVLRSAASLTEAARALDALAAGGDDRKPAEPGVDAWETANLHLVARALVTAALRRAETRGSHWREDHPERDDAQWRRHLVLTARPGHHPGAEGPVLCALDVRATDTTAFPETVVVTKEKQ